MLWMDRSVSEGECSTHREAGDCNVVNIFEKYSSAAVDFVIPISPRIGIHRSPIISMPRETDHRNCVASGRYSSRPWRYRGWRTCEAVHKEHADIARAFYGERWEAIALLQIWHESSLGFTRYTAFPRGLSEGPPWVGRVR